MIFGSFFPWVFSFYWYRWEREKRRAGREAFGLQSINTPRRLRCPDDPVGLHLRQTFLSTVADWGSLFSLPSHGFSLTVSHHPDRSLHRNNKRCLGNNSSRLHVIYICYLFSCISDSARNDYAFSFFLSFVK